MTYSYAYLVFMLQDHIGYNSVKLGIAWYNSVQLRLILF